MERGGENCDSRGRGWLLTKGDVTRREENLIPPPFLLLSLRRDARHDVVKLYDRCSSLSDRAPWRINVFRKAFCEKKVYTRVRRKKWRERKAEAAFDLRHGGRSIR